MSATLACDKTSAACMEYAIAVDAVRAQTRIMMANRCEEASKEERDSSSGRIVSAEVPSCMSRHWEIDITKYGERPMLAFEDMCEPCQVRLQAYEARKEAKKRLGAAKRSVEAVGKRLIKVQRG